MLYNLKVKLLKTSIGNSLWSKLQVKKGHTVGDDNLLKKLIKEYSYGNTFIDVGCMWGVNGDYSFYSEQCGASLVKALDVYGPTPKFEERKKNSNSIVEFILGDITDKQTISKIGKIDVVFCAGVLYHHPNPFQILASLRQISKKILILKSFTIPEFKDIPNAAIFLPFLQDSERNLWNLDRLGFKKQFGISGTFDPEREFGNWFWGLTPSCIASMLNTLGFEILNRYPEPFAHTFVCSAIKEPLKLEVPDEGKARKMGIQDSIQND